MSTQPDTLPARARSKRWRPIIATVIVAAAIAVIWPLLSVLAAPFGCELYLPFDDAVLKYRGPGYRYDVVFKENTDQGIESDTLLDVGWPLVWASSKFERPPDPPPPRGTIRLTPTYTSTEAMQEQLTSVRITHPAALVLSIAIHALAALGLLATASLARKQIASVNRQHALQKGLCPRCGYEVGCVPGPLCPECGSNLVRTTDP